VSSRASASVDLWTLELSASQLEVAGAASMLSRQERSRAARYRRTEDRRRFVVAHGLVRIVLGLYLAIAPDELVFTEGPRGKPTVSDPPRPLSYSLSHSGRRALLAVSDGAEVGVDVECASGFRFPDAALLAARSLAAEELEALARVRPNGRPRAVLQAWTRKEAALKARGDGLRADLRRFAALPRGASVGFCVYDLPLGRPYVGALASLLPVGRRRDFGASWCDWRRLRHCGRFARATRADWEVG